MANIIFLFFNIFLIGGLNLASSMSLFWNKKLLFFKFLSDELEILFGFGLMFDIYFFFDVFELNIEPGFLLLEIEIFPIVGTFFLL